MIKASSESYFTFTKEEEACLFTAQDKIADWIFKNIIPDMNGSQEINIEFECGKNCFGDIRRNQLTVYGRNHNFHNPNTMQSRFSTFITYDDGVNGECDFLTMEDTGHLYSVIKAWEFIKPQLLKEAEKRKEVSMFIKNFEI